MIKVEQIIKKFSLISAQSQPLSQNEEKLKQYTLKEVAVHCRVDSCWMIVSNKVYDLTDFIEYHPGGYEIMLEYGGSDATNAFIEKPHTIEATDMFEKYLIGELINRIACLVLDLINIIMHLILICIAFNHINCY